MTFDNDFIPFGQPTIGEEERELALKVLSGTRLVHGPLAAEFEQKIAARVGVKHAVSVSSCTAGLHLILLANKIGPGDEVIVPAMSHVASAHVVEFCGAKPVFVDVCDATGNIDLDLIEDKITPATRAIMTVHYLGLPCDMDRLNSIADNHGLFVFEDCATAIDAEFDGRNAGNLSLAGAFSFYPAKHITTCEGGMVTTNDDDLADTIRKLKAFGYDKGLGERDVPGVYDVMRLGFNYRMSEMHAAIGLAQLDKLDDFQKARSANFKILESELLNLGLSIFPSVNGKAKSSHYCFNVTLPKAAEVDRNEFIRGLSEYGVGCSVHYPSAIPQFTYYSNKYGYVAGDFPVAEWIASKTVSLPVGPHLKEGQAKTVAEAVKAVRQTMMFGSGC